MKLRRFRRFVAALAVTAALAGVGMPAAAPMLGIIRIPIGPGPIL